MRKKYKNWLLFNGILLIIFLLILISYIQYQKFIESTNPIILVEDGLSINFLNGNHLVLKEESKTIHFSITNNSNVTLKYYISIENNKKETAIFYDLTEENNLINILKNEFKQNSEKIASRISISPNESQSYTLKLYTENPVNFTAKLSVGIEEDNEEYFAETILKNKVPQKESTTTINKEIANTDEGLIEAKDDFGTIYYYRGNVKDNYVSFADMIWRIVKINSDGSVKLILNDYAKTTANFYEGNENNLEEKLDISNNKMNEYLEIWYQENLEEYESHLISNKFCVDNSIYETQDNGNIYLGNNRILTNNSISYNCLGTFYTLKIGLLSVDEVILAGASPTLNNQDYYLYIPDKTVSWWTLTPSTSDSENITFFEIDQNGKVNALSNGNYYKGMRPVINLIKKTTVTGSGTLADPYVVN